VSGSFTTTLDYEDYLAANWLMLRRRWLWKGTLRFLLTVGPLYSAIGITLRFISQGASITGAFAELATGFTLASVAVLVLWLYFFWCIPRSANKTWSQLHLDGVPTLHEFDDEAIRISNALGTSNFHWHMLSAWIENEHLLLMFRTNLMFHSVPKAQISGEELEKLRAALIAASVPTKC
jgi:hypothetical protein